MPGLATKPAATGNNIIWSQVLDDCIISVAWSPNSRLLAAATVGGSVQIFDAEDGTILQRLPSHHFGATAVSWSVSGKRLASAGQDGKIRLWNVETAAELSALEGGNSWVEHLAWCPLEDWLASGAGRKVRVWDADGALLKDYAELSSTVAALAWRPGSRRLAAAAYGGITMWEGDKLEPRRTFEWKGSILEIAWSPDGRHLATGDQDSTVHFWIIRSGRDLQMFGYPRKVRELAWDSGSRYLATGGGSDVTIWDCSGKGPENSTPIVLRAHQAPLSSLAFQARGSLLASADEDGDVCLWRPARNKKLLGQFGLKDGISQLVWSPDEQRLAIGSNTGELAVVRVE